MGIGRKERDQQLEERHREYLDGIEHSEYPDWVHQMYEQPVYTDHKHFRRKMIIMRVTGWIILLSILVGSIYAVWRWVL
jgi:hypothetical protein